MSDVPETNDEFQQLSEALNSSVDERVEQDDVLNMKEFNRKQLTDLQKFKDMRVEMVAKRDALNKSIGLLDKRIEIALEAIKTIHKPL